MICEKTKAESKEEFSLTRSRLCCILHDVYDKGGDIMPVSEKRTQIYFPMEVYRKIERKARDESRSVASIIREAVERYLMEYEPEDWDNDPFFEIVGLGESDRGDLAENHDKYLYTTDERT